MTMDHYLVLLPILIPLAAAAIALLLHKYRRLQAGWSLAAMLSSLVASLLLLARVWDSGQPLIFQSGGWPAPMGISLVAGRNLERSDVWEGENVVLLNETAAEHIFEGQTALGNRIVSAGQEWVVVGIVKDVRHVSPERGSGPQVYFPRTQMQDYRTMDLVVRSALPTDQIAGAVATALQELDPAMPVRETWTVQSTVDRALSPRRFTLGVIITYGAVALLLATLGIYGVLAQSVAERTDEIGIRVALGASRGSLIRGVLGRILFLTGAGVAIGAAASVAAGRLAASLLFGVTPTDPVTFGAMAVILPLVAALAGWIPARTAAHIRGTRALQAQ